MKKPEFLALDDDSKLNYLNEEAAKGLSYGDICVGIGMTKEELGKIGYYFVRNKFMKKPMKGYGTTERSGNEYTDRFK
ncbi:hypothetical protein LPY66_05290 [Dehalobacter sp. DCM]|uniref:hypothetical protein n=1 Tax=Dehalobacter sp. DCM TaxID=2907827 RepID=UPI0030816B2A|nr:hypothetical protein LPY66_05290 [Dehalobacter sp. DCM]